MKEEARFTIHLEQLDNYEFTIKFDWPETPDLHMDEPPPLGNQQGPNASRLLAAAAANCLSASLLFCLKKNEVPTNSIRTQATGIVVRNEKNRLRIGGLEISLSVNQDEFDATRLTRCLQMFEDYCVVSASLRDGIPIRVNVVDDRGNLLHSSA